MPVTITIPTALRQFAGGKSQFEVEAGTAGEALNQLSTEFAELKRHLYDDRNKLRSFVNVYVNDEDIRHQSGIETPVKDGDTLMIVPSIAGGATAEADVAADLPSLSNEEIARYSRHLIMPEVGLQGQKRLKAASVLMIGTGGLGAPLGMYLAAAGVGRLGIVDFDVVESSNLQRQIIHGTKDIGRPKIESARDRLNDINPHIEIETHEARLTSDNALRLFQHYDIVVDGTDNFPTRYLVNDACVLSGKPNVYGSIFRFEGQASVFWAERGACYRCLYPEPPPPGLVPSCAEGGVLGVLPGIVGAIQANETIKIILKAEGILVNRLLLFDAWAMKFRELKLRKDAQCPICGDNPTIKELIDYEAFCGLSANQQAEPPKLEEITATELKRRLDSGENIQIIDVREPHEYEIARLPGTKLIPLSQVVKRMSEIDAARETVVHCKGGVRSAKAIEALKLAAFPGRLINLKGGITAWSEDVDATVPKY
jgi:molybdopterin/thiamine biosynthesis adenylyltransferase/rhodanese-related sulfurtransferase/molybdopterin converting factor small subunit